MGRMETGGQHFEDLRLEARIDGELADRAGQYLDESGDAKAQLVRDALDAYLPDTETADGPRIKPPETDDLQTALSILQRLAKNNSGSIPREVALSELAQQFSRSTQACDTTLIQPLANAGYLVPRGGLHGRETLGVILPSDIPDVLDAAEAPVERDDDELGYDDPETASDRLDALRAAGEEVAD